MSLKRKTEDQKKNEYKEEFERKQIIELLEKYRKNFPESDYDFKLPDAFIMNDGTIIDVGKRSQKVRVSYGFTQQELASKMGVSRAMVSEVERGVRRFGQGYATRFLQSLPGANMSYIFGAKSKAGNRWEELGKKIDASCKKEDADFIFEEFKRLAIYLAGEEFFSGEKTRRVSKKKTATT